MASSSSPKNEGARTGPVRPRSAASLIVVRKSGGVAQVLLGRRVSRHRFLPNVFVFPGGRLDADDHLTEPVRHLPATTVQAMRHATADIARALAVAAVRETFEETGLAFGEMEGERFRPDLGALGYFARAITPSSSPIRFHARFFIMNAEEATGTLGGSGELADLDWYPLDRALTLPLADVTEFILGEVRDRHVAGVDDGRTAFFGYHGGKPRIRRE